MQLEFYWDAAGDPRAQCKGPGAMVAGFLESDLQGSIASAHEVLRAIDGVESGEIPEWERTGNAFTLALAPEAATLWNEMDEEVEPYRLSLADFRQIVADWVSFLDDGRGI
jgi:uncharacterized protein YacL (UPF0231 family)